jgi:hypothetical protein
MAFYRTLIHRWSDVLYAKPDPSVKDSNPPTDAMLAGPVHNDRIRS